MCLFKLCISVAKCSRNVEKRCANSLSAALKEVKRNRRESGSSESLESGTH